MTTNVHVLNLGPGAVDVKNAGSTKRLYNHQAVIMTVYDGAVFTVGEVKPGAAAVSGLLTPQIDQTLPNVPGGWVQVSPKGVHGVGKVRLWPANPPGEGPWSYAERLAKIIVSGKPLWQAGRDMSVSMAMNAHNFTAPEAVDYLTYTDDWRSQAEIDALAHKDDRPWISTPTPKPPEPGPVDVPIGSEP